MSIVKSEVAFDQAGIDKAVAVVAKAGKAMSRGIETVLVMAVYDSIVNKSAAVANSLVNVLRSSTKKDGIKAFLEAYGQLYDKGGKTGFVHFASGSAARLSWSKGYVDLVQEAAIDWEAFKAAPEAKDFDVVKALELIVTKSNKDGVVIHKALAAYITPLIAQYMARIALEAAQAKVVDPAKVEEGVTA